MKLKSFKKLSAKLCTFLEDGTQINESSVVPYQSSFDSVNPCEKGFYFRLVYFGESLKGCCERPRFVIPERPRLDIPEFTESPLPQISELLKFVRG